MFRQILLVPNFQQDRNLNSVGVVDLFFSLLIAICCMFRNSERYKANVIVLNIQISRADLKESLLNVKDAACMKSVLLAKEALLTLQVR